MENKPKNSDPDDSRSERSERSRGDDPRPSKSKRPPLTPDEAKMAKDLRTFALVMVFAFICQLLPLPWALASILFVLAALFYGVKSLVTAIKTRARGMNLVMVMMGLVMSGYLVLATVGLLIFYPVQFELQECMAGALTEQAAQKCQSAFNDSLESWMTSFLPEAPG